MLMLKRVETFYFGVFVLYIGRNTHILILFFIIVLLSIPFVLVKEEEKNEWDQTTFAS